MTYDPNATQMETEEGDGEAAIGGAAMESDETQPVEGQGDEQEPAADPAEGYAGEGGDEGARGDLTTESEETQGTEEGDGEAATSDLTMEGDASEGEEGQGDEQEVTADPAEGYVEEGATETEQGDGEAATGEPTMENTGTPWEAGQGDGGSGASGAEASGEQEGGELPQAEYASGQPPAGEGGQESAQPLGGDGAAQPEPVRQLSTDEALNGLEAQVDPSALRVVRSASAAQVHRDPRRVEMELPIDGVTFIPMNRKVDWTPPIAPKTALMLERMARWLQERGVDSVEVSYNVGDPRRLGEQVKKKWEAGDFKGKTPSVITRHNMGFGVDVFRFRGTDPSTGTSFEYDVNRDWAKDGKGSTRLDTGEAAQSFFSDFRDFLHANVGAGGVVSYDTEPKHHYNHFHFDVWSPEEKREVNAWEANWIKANLQQ